MRVALSTAAAIVILILSIPASADIPQVMSYQGKVTDSGGNPVADGTYNMQFDIYDTDTGGTALWSSGTIGVQVTSGIFFVLLGETPQPILNLDFSNDYWLEINVESDVQSPRLRFGSVGYAYMASGLVPGTVVDGDLFVNGDIGIGTTSPNLSLDVESDDATYTGIEMTNMDGGQGRWAILSNSDGSTYAAPKGFGIRDLQNFQTRLTIDTSGRVGIGTLNPTSMLHVIGGISGNARYGVVGRSDHSSGAGVSAYNTSTAGPGYAVYAETATQFGYAIFVRATATAGQTYGVHAIANADGGAAVRGCQDSFVGTTYGVVGENMSTAGAGVKGRALSSTGNASGVYGYAHSPDGRGVYGNADPTTGITYGVYGVTNSTDGRGVYGWADATTGETYGVYGVTNSVFGVAVRGLSQETTGTNYGVYGSTYSNSGYGGYFHGDVHVTGTLTKSSGSFLIDHPLDPENKLLRHNFVESPENLLIYRGKARLDERGEVVVKMPGYFRALTTNFNATVNLTPVGKWSVSETWSFGYEWSTEHDAFTAYGQPGGEVAWMVTAERDDPVIRQLARPVEEDKGPNNKYCDRGKLLNPTAYGYPENMGRDYEVREKERLLLEEETRRLEDKRTRLEEERAREERQRVTEAGSPLR